MSNTIRIRTTPDGSDNYLKVKLEQDFDFIEILSLKISQEDTYRKFCSDYGVVVGRVTVNNGFGVPNAKVSVFIPLDDIDKNDPLIKGLYPFEALTDKDGEGVRYNLLPKDGDESNDCSTPIGTFPSKREVLDNESLLKVYCKYYKFTTTTNHAGDFMLFGVPVGTYNIHLDADISDIGIISQRPYDLISQGTPSKLFDSPTKFKGGNNLDKLVQVKTLNAGVNVQPFWGDKENCEIGINRLDLILNYTITPTAIFMGSIFGDQDKHSINKKCTPRLKLGLLCDQVAGPGSVSMIRKTIDGQIEEFDVEGGRVIDDDGTWAYQVPMNLDYMVTDEGGNLILSQDPNVGIATRARVRFNIGMDETGGEGRLRTRARYLVPNNPSNPSEVDYEFGPNTKDTSFRDLYWNKIYSVSNYISRFQKKLVPSPPRTRNMTAIKDVDACAGDKTPFPYNRVNTLVNPIFFIICLIIKIIGFLIFIMNNLIIPLINFIIKQINDIITFICGIINTIIKAINKIPKVNISTISCPVFSNIGCLYVRCPTDDGPVFAPGCRKSGGLDNGVAFQKTSPNTPVYYYDDGIAGHDSFGSPAGLDNCIAFQVAEALNLFQFDFYNDWINGSLFGFLLKYKKKKKKSEKFCEYDCKDFGGGVDGNNNGIQDNNCHNNTLVDTCFSNSKDEDCQISYYEKNIRDGLIKKVGDEFFYAATTHNVGYKLFPTEIINLGSVFDCDWQGIHKIQDLLIPTTYKIPPDIQEINDDGVVEECGMVNIGGNTSQVFFNIDCLGLHVDYKGCLNLRHICEIGVDIDQIQEDPLTGTILFPSDCIIGSNDIDDDSGKFFRNVFLGLNNSNTPYIGVNTLTLPSNGFTTDFNTSNLANYDFTSGGNINGADYINFRGYTPSGQNNFGQTKHSYFFYFGLLPGKTALDKMNERFFTDCSVIIKNDIIIQATTTVATGPTGTITFTFVGGTGPYTYTVSGIAPTSYPNNNGIANPTDTLMGLSSGTYLITGFDSLGTPVSKTVIVPSPPPLYCTATVTKNATTAGISDGEITITAVGGGQTPYTYEVRNFIGAIIEPEAQLSIPKIVTGLAVDDVFGYTIVVKDSATPKAECPISGLKVSGPTIITLSSANIINIECFGENTGSFDLQITGGKTPYVSVLTTGPGYSSPATQLTNLIAGTYSSKVVDSLGTTQTLQTILTHNNPKMTIVSASEQELAKQCDPLNHIIPFFITEGAANGTNVSVQYSIDNGSFATISLPYVNPTTPMVLTIPSTASLNLNITIRYKNSSSTCTSNEITIPKSSIELPPAVLSITTLPSTKQCVAGQVTFGFDLNYLTRAPYTVNYKINGVSKPSVSVSSNPTIITAPVTTTSSNIAITVIDSKGCSVTHPIFTLQTPSSVLAINISTNFDPITTKYTHSVTGSGGIAPISGTGVFGPDSNPTITKTITDSVGCTATGTG